MKSNIYIIVFLICIPSTFGQNQFEYSGQISAFGSYNPNSHFNTLFVGRYIPQLSYSIITNKDTYLDYEASANINGSLAMHPFDTIFAEGNLQPYRLWARYYGNQFEARLGLQKIDFGSATLLRPLQWFNQVDPRDPLKITNGVYAALGRYYFLNNANVWLWVLYGNEKRRGLDAVESYKKDPEYGGRIQYPMPTGEIALSYHHRTADASELLNSDMFKKIPEDRIGLDGKWDIEIGLWMEAVYIHKSVDIGMLTNQTLFNIGADYTFGIGNGLNLMIEHLILSYDQRAFEFDYNNNISASSISYPLGLDDNISGILNYSWNSNDLSFFLNLEHQFQNFTGHAMIYYNSASQIALQENLSANNFTGPGVQIMFVYNH